MADEIAMLTQMQSSAPEYQYQEPLHISCPTADEKLDRLGEQLLELKEEMAKLRQQLSESRDGFSDYPKPGLSYPWPPFDRTLTTWRGG